MSGKVFTKPGKGYLVIGYGRMALFRHKPLAFGYAKRLDEPRVEDLQRALPGWTEISE